MKSLNMIGTASLFAIATLATALAQSGTQTASPQAGTTSAAATSPDAQGNYATGKPLEMQSKERFWGHLNPLARKRWVHRQIDPVADRANELDGLEAKNAGDIRDVDARATAGVNRAMGAANQADTHAADAASRADQASSAAAAANARTTALNGTVSNLDQYQPVSSKSLTFVPGHTALTTKAKANLDDVASSLASEKGYIVEVQGYSRAGVAPSQAMADSVVRYLVTAHQVPVYRIYRTGMGKVSADQQDVATTDTGKPLTNGVRVTVLHNSLASMPGDSPTPTSAPSSN